MIVSRFCVFAAILGLAPLSIACDLCAIYSASNARGEFTRGFLFTLSEQFVPYRTVMLDGEELPSSVLDDAFLDSSMTHLVPGFNVTARFGLSLNIPVVHKRFQRFELQPTGIVTEEGTESGVGDVTLVGRWTAFQHKTMKYSASLNVMGGVKFPTGDADRIEAEVEKDRILSAIYGPGHTHFVGGVHEHDLALGSGSFDGVFGLAGDIRWQRWFANVQVQYYLRTEGESSFEFGDELIVSGGPGAYVLLHEKYTLSLQANAVYDTMARDRIEGDKLNQTGMTAWYLGPQLSFTWGGRFSANLGVDIPVDITNNGLRNVPDYQLHGGITWRF